MTLTIQTIRYGEGETFSGYLAYPARAELPIPGVIVIQEAWGVDEHIQDVTRRIAAAGYAAFAPDVFTRNGVRSEAMTADRLAAVKDLIDELPPGSMMDPGAREVALARRPAEVAAQLRTSFQIMMATLGDVEANMAPVVAADRFLRDQLAVTRGQKIASVGFCLGGGLSARLAAADPDLAGAAVFYGIAPPEDLIARIRCPIAGFYGALDERINPGIAGFATAMKQHGQRFEYQIYPGAQHAFFNDTRRCYQVNAARDAYARLLGFLRDQLPPNGVGG